MVATRSAARKAQAAEAATAPATTTTLKAPPKRPAKKASAPGPRAKPKPATAAPKPKAKATKPAQKPKPKAVAAAPEPKPEPPKAVAAPAPTEARRTTRAMAKIAVPADSPLKQPAKKPAAPKAPLKRAPRKKNAKPTKPNSPIEENPFANYPNYPNYPSTPAPPQVVASQAEFTTPQEEVPPHFVAPQAEFTTPQQEVSPHFVATKANSASSELPIFLPTVSASPVKSALRSPVRFAEPSPNKAVSFTPHPYGGGYDSSLLIPDGPLSGTLFYLDIRSDGQEQNHFFISLLEDLGARVCHYWTSDTVGVTHVVFKDGSPATLQKVAESNGEVKCVNLGWALDCEKNNRRMDESDYLVDLKTAAVNTSAPPIRRAFTPARRAFTPVRRAFTPAHTPGRFFGEMSDRSSILSLPTTPTSSDFDKTMSEFDFPKTDKENIAPKSCPPKPQAKFSWLNQSPVKAAPGKSPFAMTMTAARKRKNEEESFPGFQMGIPKKPRFI